MQNQPKTALIILGHGSHISPNTAQVVWDAVDNLHKIGVADEITGAFWKEQPNFRGVLSSICATDITLVPLFTAQGYFTQTVIPTEMGLTGQITHKGGQIIRYAQPPVYHPKIQQIVQMRIDDAIAKHNLAPSEVGIVVIGHSTRKNASSRKSTEYQAEALRQKEIYGSVITAFLDDDPEIITMYDRIAQPTIIAIPLFLAMGSHTTIDVPEAMLLPPNSNDAFVNDKQVIYTPAIGDDNDLTDLILDLARDVGAPLYAPHPQKSAWNNFPQGGWDKLQARLMNEKVLTIGDLHITSKGVGVVGDDHPTITSPAQLRHIMRENPFRPLMTAKVTSKGWFAPAQSLDEVCAIIETVYPTLIPHLFVDKNCQTTPINETITRQTGIYRKLADLNEAQIQPLVDDICVGCIRQPTWHNGISSPIACDEACNWWLSNALEKVEDYHMTTTIGKVYLVGAGPGDPDLITVKGLRLLQHADVVIYDRLAPKALLSHVPNDAELIDASKDGHNHTLKQPEINELLVKKAKEGKQVVRLKGGDPFVFGRGAEEALYCHIAGVPFEVVPGISSAIAVPAYAGVSVTHRDYASAFTVFTGHENPNKPASMLNFEAIAHAAKAGTLVMLMGATYLQDLINHLIASGIDPQTPAMCIEWGTIPQQRVVSAPLVNLPERAKAENIGSPAITVIGEVVNLREQGLRWFD